MGNSFLSGFDAAVKSCRSILSQLANINAPASCGSALQIFVNSGLQLASDDLGNRAALFDQGGKLRRLQRLRPIAPSTFRTGMDFDDQTVRSGRNRRQGHVVFRSGSMDFHA